jgi:tRNA-2-methylthio-N6-dimethylallyladenosine synthase
MIYLCRVMILESNNQMKYHILTLGCQMNKSDSERVRTVIESMGYQWTEQEDEASLLGILACSVRQKSIDKVYSRIIKWNKWKSRRNVLTFVSGCVLPADREKFLALFDLQFTISELSSLSDMIRQYGIVTPFMPQSTVQEHTRRITPARSVVNRINNRSLSPEENIRTFWKLQPNYISEFEAFVPIQNGCDKFCSFCAVPYTRGREISRSSDEILAEVRQLVDKGYKTITLLGQNVNSYGLDRHGTELTFPSLMKAIGEYGKTTGKTFWVYFTSPHPLDMTSEVLEIMASYDCLAKQVHLPLQSADDEVLRRMNRKHSFSDYMHIVDSIRKILPAATLFTDIIVGFTGETDTQFNNTLNAMKAIHFNMAYIAVYSPRPGAASARWEDDIPMQVKKERFHILTNELALHSLQYNNSLIGKRLMVLVTGYDRKQGYLSGFTEGHIVVRFAVPQQMLPGTFVWIEVTAAAPYSIEGRFLSVYADKLHVS